jgi:hypothetical protein
MASSVQRSKDDAIMVVYRVKRVVYNSWYTHYVHTQTLISSDADVGHQMLAGHNVNSYPAGHRITVHVRGCLHACCVDGTHHDTTMAKMHSEGSLPCDLQVLVLFLFLFLFSRSPTALLLPQSLKLHSSSVRYRQTQAPGNPEAGFPRMCMEAA